MGANVGSNMVSTITEGNEQGYLKFKGLPFIFSFEGLVARGQRVF
jgi:hypothetical protein